MSSSLLRELREYREKYERMLEALQSQQLVIDKLDSLLWTKVEPQPLVTDSATEIELGVFSSSQSVFMLVAQLKIRIERMRERRRVAQERYQFYLEQLRADIANIKSIVGEALPVKGTVDALLQREMSSSQSVAANVRQGWDVASANAPASPIAGAGLLQGDSLLRVTTTTNSGVALPAPVRKVSVPT